MSQLRACFKTRRRARGEGFWPWPRRRVPRIPAAGCKERANAGHGQKTRRPEGFRAKDRLAPLLRGGRAQRLPRRASPSGLLPENRPPANFKTGSEAGVETKKTFRIHPAIGVV